MSASCGGGEPSGSSSKKLVLSEIVRGFLELALVHPDEPPKQQYRQRENQAQIIGFNMAQEALRTVLREQGAAEDIKALAEVRSEKQQQPIKVGDTTTWVM